MGRERLSWAPKLVRATSKSVRPVGSLESIFGRDCLASNRQARDAETTNPSYSPFCAPSMVGAFSGVPSSEGDAPFRGEQSSFTVTPYRLVSAARACWVGVATFPGAASL